METLIPNTVLFAFRIDLGRIDLPPRPDPTLECFEPFHRLPLFGPLDGETPYASFYAGWSQSGLAFGLDHARWSGAFHSDSGRPAGSDGLRVYIDTRDRKDVHRGTRFCLGLFIRPEFRAPADPVATVSMIKLPRARQDPPTINTQRIDVAVRTRKQAWQMAVHLPAEVLPGYDPAQFASIGLQLVLQDRVRGRLHLGPGEDLDYASNPSTWVSCRLV